MDYQQKIIEEAANMFRMYGIRAVTMDMLAERLGMSKRTIYEVFSDKDELLKGVLKMMSWKQYDLMKKILNESENVIQAIFKMIDSMMDHFHKMSPAFQLDIKRFHGSLLDNPEEMKDLPYYSNNSEIILRGIKEGVFRDDIDVEITNKCMLEVVKLSNDKDGFSGDDYLNKNVIMNLYINYLRGISTPKGLKLINFYLNNENK